MTPYNNGLATSNNNITLLNQVNILEKADFH